MGRVNNKGRTKSGPPFVMLRYDIIESDAWGSLKASARAVLIQLMSRYRGQNNGRLGASVDALASECNLAPNTVTAALATLIEVGFIERTRQAGFSCKNRMAAEYGLMWVKCDKTGRAGTNDFKRPLSSEPGGADAGLLAGPASRLPSLKNHTYG